MYKIFTKTEINKFFKKIKNLANQIKASTNVFLIFIWYFLGIYLKKLFNK